MIFQKSKNFLSLTVFWSDRDEKTVNAMERCIV